MATIIESIDAEISRLREVRNLLAKSGQSGSAAVAGTKKRVKRVLSPEARARIAAAQRKRWAAAKKSSK
jgi:hypothetical protein